MTQDEKKAFLKKVTDKIRVTKVVATRSVKTGRGDFFTGFSSAFNSVQDDVSGPGTDLEVSVTDSEVASNGMTLKEAKIAHLVLAMQADQSAYEAAYANSAITEEQLVDAKKAIRSNYNRLISMQIDDGNVSS